MNVCITAKELRAALKEIRKAENNGFNHCLAVFKLGKTGNMLCDNTLKYVDLWDKAHPTDGNLDWGRQGASKTCKFDKKTKELIPLK